MKELLTNLGIDRAIAYTLFGRGWQVVAGLITLWMVAKHLTPGEQGFYYTFSSILALQIFFELGLSYVIMQFASHERAHLSWSADGFLEGDLLSKDRLRSLFRYSFRWYGLVALLVFVVVLPSGWLFFYLKNTEVTATVSWRIAWVGLVASTAIFIFVNSIYSLLEGCGLVVEVARVRIFQSLVGSTAVWLVLAGDGGLLAAPAMTISSTAVGIVWLIHSKQHFIRDMLVHAQDDRRISWLSEIWPFQWKIAVSWMSGYFMFQLFNPVLFAYRGPIEAGQMGMSIIIAGAVMTLPMAWMSTKLPRFGMLVAKFQFNELDALFFKAFWQSLGVLIALAIILSVANFILHQYEVKISARVLEPLPFMLLMMTNVLNYVAFAQAAYLRAHKQEPFLLLYVVSGIMICGSAILLAKDYGSAGIVMAYFMISIMGSFLGTWILQAKRREWHSVSAQDETVNSEIILHNISYRNTDV